MYKTGINISAARQKKLPGAMLHQRVLKPFDLL
jgi:hypothetical protein